MRRFASLSLPAGRLARAALLAGALALAGAIVPAAQASADDPNSQTTLVSSANPSFFGQGVTLTATVSAASPATGTPTGSVTFSDGSTQLGTATLNGTGTATITTGSGGVPSLAAGSHSITATYNGDSAFGSSTSNTVTQVVGQGHTTTALTSSPNGGYRVGCPADSVLVAASG